jgi:hypothetical protein
MNDKTIMNNPYITITDRALRTLGQCFLGSITFGAYNYYLVSKSMDYQIKTIDLGYNHKLKMIENDYKEKIKIIETDYKEKIKIIETDYKKKIKIQNKIIKRQNEIIEQLNVKITNIEKRRWW